MLNKSVARRYADAFFSIAQDHGKIDEFELELEKVLQVIASTENLKEYLAHILIPANQKKDIVEKVWSGQISDMTINFLKMVIDKRRQNYLELIVKEYQEMADVSRNITKADFIVAQEISAEEAQELAQKLSVTTGKTVEFNVLIDPSLIGGVKIRLGDQVIDGSVAKKLESIKEKLIQAKIS